MYIINLYINKTVNRIYDFNSEKGLIKAKRLSVHESSKVVLSFGCDK